MPRPPIRPTRRTTTSRRPRDGRATREQRGVDLLDCHQLGGLGHDTSGKDRDGHLGEELDLIRSQFGRLEVWIEHNRGSGSPRTSNSCTRLCLRARTAASSGTGYARNAPAASPPTVAHRRRRGGRGWLRGFGQSRGFRWRLWGREREPLFQHERPRLPHRGGLCSLQELSLLALDQGDQLEQVGGRRRSRCRT